MLQVDIILTTSNIFVLPVVGVVWKVIERPQLRPPAAKTIGGIKLKIGSINYLGSLTKRVKFHICNPSGVVWAMG